MTQSCSGHTSGGEEKRGQGLRLCFSLNGGRQKVIETLTPIGYL